MGACNPSTHGFYLNDQGIPGGPGSNPGEVTKVTVSFGQKSQDAFDDEYQTGENQIIHYKLETIGCTYGNASYYFTPRPVNYSNGAPVDPPKCNNSNRPKVRDEYVQGRFINDSNIFTPVSDVSNIFEFKWCPNQDQFHVTVFRSGNYVFTHHTGLELLQAEIDQHDTTVAEMQAEIDQLQADNIQLQANNTQCATPPSSPPSLPPTGDTCTDEATDFTCKKKKCKSYSDAEKKQCKRSCGKCDAESAPPSPPSLPPTGDTCAGLKDDKTCKIKDCEKVDGKCKKLCKKNKLKKKCKKTCCDLS